MKRRAAANLGCEICSESQNQMPLLSREFYNENLETIAFRSRSAFLRVGPEFF